MTRTLLRSTIMAAALTAATSLGAVPAAAEGCLSPFEIRAAVQSGRAMPLREVIAGVTGSTGGEVVSMPSLCQEGGALVYHFTVLSNGRAIPVTADARTGQARY